MNNYPPGVSGNEPEIIGYDESSERSDLIESIRKVAQWCKNRDALTSLTIMVLENNRNDLTYPELSEIGTIIGARLLEIENDHA